MRFKNIKYFNFLLLVFYNLSILCSQTTQIDSVGQRGVSLATPKLHAGEIKKELSCICKELNSVLCKEKTIITKIDQCCATLNSKIDLAIEGVSIVATCDLYPIVSSVDGCCGQLNSGIDAISTEIDACCNLLTSTIQTASSAVNNLVISCCDSLLAFNASIFAKTNTVESQIDVLDVDVQQCCSTLNSKVDSLLLGITVNASCDFSTVNSKLDTCCNALSSKIDLIADGMTVTAICDLASVTSKLDQCCTTLTSKIDQIDTNILTCCFTLNSKVDGLISPSASCKAIAITSPTTLLTPGVYCLAQNITSALATTIEIGADNITLDLNGYNISNSSAGGTGIRLSNSASHITIKNGSVHKLTGGANGIGINVSFTGNPSDIHIEKVMVSGWNLGITGLQVGSVVIQQCIIRNNNVHGIFFDAGSENILIAQSLIKVNNGDGIRLTSATQVVINENTINANGGNGLHVTAASLPGSGSIKISSSTFDENNLNGVLLDQNSDCIEISDCHANRSMPTTGIFGFACSAASNVLIQHCNACGFDRGFSIVDGSGSNLTNNIAKGNITGFFTSNGQGILSHNTADNNSTGFNNVGGSYQFYSNISCLNGANYVGSITSAPITSPANVLGVENVDCTNTTPNEIVQTQSKLDVCCLQLNSKLDSLSTTTIVVTCNLSPITSNIDQCCATIASSVHELSLCHPIPVTSQTSITASGHYCLAQSISGSGPIITISGASASHISLDLNGYTLNTNGGQCILIDGLTTHTGISIYNGTLSGANLANGIEVDFIAIPHNDIQLKNLSFHGFEIGFLVNAGEQISIENCNFDSNFVHALITNAQDIRVEYSTFTNSTFASGFDFNTCSNILIQNSTFSFNQGYGLDLLAVNNALLKDSMFNSNGLTGISPAGLALANCNGVTAQNCIFGTQDGTAPQKQSYGVLIGDANSNLTFENSSFNANGIDGLSVQSSIAASCLKFVGCQANGNQRYGYRIFGNISDVIFDSCITCSNATGFRVENIVGFPSPSNICFDNSIAKQNSVAGFSLVSGTGLLKENIAVDNGGCGFDDFVFTTSSFSYVANVAKDNGATPAGVNDTNYCLASVGSGFAGNGPGAFPYRQVSLDLPPSSYWNNITLP